MFKDTTGIMRMDLDMSGESRYIMVTKKRRETRLIERLIPLNKGVKFRLIVDTILSVSFVRITGSKGEELISMCTLNTLIYSD